jgi:hypothetical protein
VEALVPRLFACALGCALIVAAVSPAAPVPQHLMKQPVYYFPTKLGAKLTYAEPGSETERTLVVTAVSDRGGAKVVSVGRLNHDDTVTPQMTMAVTGCGLFRLERGGVKFETPETWLKLPAEKSCEWEYPTGDSSIAPRPLVWNTIVGTEEVTVPAGTFRCIRVQTQQGARSATYWFAPDVGLVKTEAPTWTEVLKSYTPGKE